MGRLEGFAKNLVKKYLDRGLTPEGSCANAKTRVYKAITEYDERIDEILDRFNRNPPQEWLDLIGEFNKRKQTEREFLSEIDARATAGWSG